MDDFNRLAQEASNGDGESIEPRRTESAGALGKVSCVYIGDELVLRTRPETRIYPYYYMGRRSVSRRVTDVQVGCPRFFKCDSCPERTKTTGSVAVSVGQMDPAEVQRMTEGTWNSGSVE